MIELDGSQGEGGGQIVRSALALSAYTGRPFRLLNIRAHRRNPGLQRQHLVAVQAAAQICSASVTGAELGSSSLQFSPGTVRPGVYSFDIGTAGSVTLVLQTVLPALLKTAQPTQLTIHGGTHNPLAPSFDYIRDTFLPVLARMGAAVRVHLTRHGFYPAGGGRIEVGITPCPQLHPLRLLTRGELQYMEATALVARLPLAIARRELDVVHRELGLAETHLHAVPVSQSRGPGNVLSLRMVCTQVTEVISVCGRPRLPAEEVAMGAVRQAREYLDGGAPVDVHLADQLIVPMALAGSGEYVTSRPDSHTLTNISVVERFVDVKFTVREEGQCWRVSCELNECGAGNHR